MRPMKQTRHRPNVTALTTQKLCALCMRRRGRTRFSPRMPAPAAPRRFLSVSLSFFHSLSLSLSLSLFSPLSPCLALFLETLAFQDSVPVRRRARPPGRLRERRPQSACAQVLTGPPRPRVCTLLQQSAPDAFERSRARSPTGERAGLARLRERASRRAARLWRADADWAGVGLGRARARDQGEHGHAERGGRNDDLQADEPVAAAVQLDVDVLLRVLDVLAWRTPARASGAALPCTLASYPSHTLPWPQHSSYAAPLCPALGTGGSTPHRATVSNERRTAPQKAPVGCERLSEHRRLALRALSAAGSRPRRADQAFVLLLSCCESRDSFICYDDGRKGAPMDTRRS